MKLKNMKDLAPHIYRQRLLLEGLYGIEVTEEIIERYFDVILNALHLNSYKDPIIHSSQDIGGDLYQGYEAFIPLIESGIVLYTWESSKFLSILIYTCKKFSIETALEKTKMFFKLFTIEIMYI